MKTAAMLAVMFLLGACVSHRVPVDPDVLIDPPTSTEPARTVFEALIRHHGMVEAIDLGADGEPASVEDTVVALETLGLRVLAFHGTDDDGPTGLRHHLQRNRPLLLLVRWNEDVRWVLVVGYDDETDLYILRDPDKGLIALPRVRLGGMWTATEHIGILALPSNE